MRAKFVTDVIEDVGLMVTTTARLRRGSFSIGTLEQRVRGETWPKVILQLFLFFGLGFSSNAYRKGLRIGLLSTLNDM